MTEEGAAGSRVAGSGVPNTGNGASNPNATFAAVESLQDLAHSTAARNPIRSGESDSFLQQHEAFFRQQLLKGCNKPNRGAAWTELRQTSSASAMTRHAMVFTATFTVPQFYGYALRRCKHEVRQGAEVLQLHSYHYELLKELVHCHFRRLAQARMNRRNLDHRAAGGDKPVKALPLRQFRDRPCIRIPLAHGWNRCEMLSHDLDIHLRP